MTKPKVMLATAELLADAYRLEAGEVLESLEAREALGAFIGLNFLLPLMRGATARGHEVVGVCADGPLLDDVRAEGLRVVPLPLARSASPLARVATTCTGRLRDHMDSARFQNRP